MKYLIRLLLGLALINTSLFAQSHIDRILLEIKENNTTLASLRKALEAEKLGNKTGLYLQNPEVEFNYLWGNPSVIGKRTDLKITQGFEFPTAYRYKQQLSLLRNNQAVLSYRKEQQALLLESRRLCLEIVYTNALKSEFTKRLQQAQQIVDAYEKQFALGETTILELNKAHLHLLNLQKKIENQEINKSVLMSRLIHFNGGNTLELNDSIFETVPIPPDFESWFVMAAQKNPIIKWLQQEIEANKKQKQLNRALSLPKLQAGYMSESMLGEQFRGITIGMSIPLWENRNTVKYSEARSTALAQLEIDRKLQFYSLLKGLHTKAVGLQASAWDYRSQLALYDNSALLMKALDRGEINLIEYIFELSLYYENIQNLLELEWELHKTIADLKQLE